MTAPVVEVIRDDEKLIRRDAHLVVHHRLVDRAGVRANLKDRRVLRESFPVSERLTVDGVHERRARMTDLR